MVAALGCFVCLVFVSQLMGCYWWFADGAALGRQTWKSADHSDVRWEVQGGCQRENGKICVGFGFEGFILFNVAKTDYCAKKL